MVNIRPDCHPDGKYNQTEAAKLLGVDRHTIRRWELDGFISFQVRKVNGSKVTTGRQIIKCWESMYL